MTRYWLCECGARFEIPGPLQIHEDPTAPHGVEGYQHAQVYKHTLTYTEEKSCEVS